MRFPVLALFGAIVATPALADPASAPISSVQVPTDVAADHPEAPSIQQPAISVAENAPAIFSEPTDPVPLLPSQRKLLRVRKV